MHARTIKQGVYWVGAVDWDRRLFDALIPLPEGTSYNAYLVQGSEKVALIDTVDPKMTHVLLSRLEGIESVDYVIAHHGEQDHSGSIPIILDRFPGATVVCSPKCKDILIDLLHITPDRFLTVEDEQELSLGDKTLKFLHTPWVHWPETMCTYLKEDRVLMSCDFFGSHWATSDLYASDKCHLYEAARRYFAEIMMPFRTAIQKDLDKVKKYDIGTICPSHGPVHDDAAHIMGLYHEWVYGEPRPVVVVPYVTMHGSTQVMVDHFVDALIKRGMGVKQFDLTTTDIGHLASALVDASTLVLASPTVLAGPHPLAAYAAFLGNALRPNIKYISLIGSYSWGGRMVDVIKSMVPNIKAELFDPVVIKGLPKEQDLLALENLAEKIASHHGLA